MKSKPAKKALTFGNLVTNFYHTYGKRKANGILRLATEAKLVEFRGRDHYILSRGDEKR